MDKVSLKQAAAELLSFNIGGPIRSSYALEYFANIVRVIPDKTPVELRFENDYPIKIIFKLAEGAIGITYFLAPCVNNG